MTVTAKFKVDQIKEAVADNTRQVILSAVYSSDKNSENYTWSKYTPSGRIEMNITNPAAYDQFEIGKEYLVTFEKVS